VEQERADEVSEPGCGKMLSVANQRRRAMCPKLTLFVWLTVLNSTTGYSQPKQRRSKWMSA
jgi:hypothetical protein